MTIRVACYFTGNDYDIRDLVVVNINFFCHNTNIILVLQSFMYTLELYLLHYKQEYCCKLSYLQDKFSFYLPGLEGYIVQKGKQYCTFIFSH